MAQIKAPPSHEVTKQKFLLTVQKQLLQNNKSPFPAKKISVIY